MGALSNYFKEKYLKKNISQAEDIKNRATVKHTIADLCEKHLVNVGDIFTFEVLPKDLPYVVSVIGEEPLVSKYDIYQINKTLFEAILKEVEI